MSGTTDYLNWFNSSITNPVARDPLVGDSSMDWRGLGTTLAPAALTAHKGAKTALDVNKAYNATKAIPSALGGVGNTANNASKLSVGLKGAGKALGGTVGIGNLAVAAGSFLPGGKESDYQTGGEKAIKLGATAAGLGSALGLGAALGPIGLGLGAIALVSNLTGRTAKKHQTTAAQTLQNTGSGYAGLGKDIAAQGKKTSGISRLFGKDYTKQINRNIARLDKKRMIAGDIGYQNKQSTIAAMNSVRDVDSRNLQSLSGGFGQYGTGILAAKRGTKLQMRNIVANVKHKVNSTKEEVKTNVIPGGALHARKHNIEGFEDNITKKGIPVISGDLVQSDMGTLELQKGGEITQHAEIEREEIIFHKDLTAKFEELLKKYEEGDEKAALEAGKLLAYEILENTEDNAGLIDKIN